MHVQRGEKETEDTNIRKESTKEKRTGRRKCETEEKELPSCAEKDREEEEENGEHSARVPLSTLIRHVRPCKKKKRKIKIKNVQNRVHGAHFARDRNSQAVHAGGGGRGGAGGFFGPALSYFLFFVFRYHFVSVPNWPRPPFISPFNIGSAR